MENREHINTKGRQVSLYVTCRGTKEWIAWCYVRSKIAQDLRTYTQNHTQIHSTHRGTYIEMQARTNGTSIYTKGRIWMDSEWYA